MSSDGATSKKMLDTQQGSALVEELLDATLLVQPSFVRLDGFEDSTKVLFAVTMRRSRPVVRSPS